MSEMTMKKIGIVSSICEIRRNKPELMIKLETLDCIWLKWDKHRIYIVVGE